MGDLDAHFKIIELEGQVRQMRTLVPRSINVLEEVKITLDEDDIDGAKRLITEPTDPLRNKMTDVNSHLVSAREGARQLAEAMNGQAEERPRAE